MSWLVQTHMKRIFKIRWDRNWFRLTETIYMKLKHYHLRDNECSI
jgi:hypothetical protein